MPNAPAATDVARELRRVGAGDSASLRDSSPRSLFVFACAAYRNFSNSVIVILLPEFKCCRSF